MRNNGQVIGEESNSPTLMGKSATRVAVLKVSSIQMVFSMFFLIFLQHTEMCNIASRIPDTGRFSSPLVFYCRI